MAAVTTKGNRAKLTTFNIWEKDGIIGYKTDTIAGIVYVNFVWCKVCARNEKEILQHPKCKGAMKDAMLRFVKGTNNVTKFAVLRHLNGEVHKIALNIDNANKPPEDRLNFYL